MQFCLNLFIHAQQSGGELSIHAELTRLTVCVRFRCVRVRFRCVRVRFRCVRVRFRCVRFRCVRVRFRCVRFRCVRVHFRCVRFRCVRVRFRCVRVRFRCVFSAWKTSHTALDSNNPERFICLPCAFGQSLYRVLIREIEGECTRWW